MLLTRVCSRSCAVVVVGVASASAARTRSSSLVSKCTRTTAAKLTTAFYAGMASSNDSDMSFWNDNFWDADSVPFHRSDVHPKLLRHLHLMTSGGDVAGGGGGSRTFFLPLCGKSVDLLHLHRLGHRVVGCEGSEKACRQFFRESQLECRESDQGPFKVLRTPDSRLRILCGNYYDLTADVLGGTVHCVWDRGAIGAIFPKDRERYADVMKSLLGSSGDFVYLAASVTLSKAWDEVEEEAAGPPFALSFEDIAKLFGDVYDVQLLETQEDTRTGGSEVLTMIRPKK